MCQQTNITLPVDGDDGISKFLIDGLILCERTALVEDLGLGSVGDSIVQTWPKDLATSVRTGIQLQPQESPHLMAKDIVATCEVLIFHPYGNILVLAHFCIDVATHFVTDIVCREIEDSNPDFRVEFVFHACDSFMEAHISMSRSLNFPRGDDTVATVTTERTI